MYSLQTGEYSEAEIRAMLTSDREVWFEFDVLDKNEIPKGQITATGSIDYNSTVSIQRTAQLEIVEERDINFLSDKIKVSMCLKTPKGTEKFPMGVFLMSSPARQAHVGTVRREIECYDLTLMLKDDKFTTRYKVEKNLNYGQALTNIFATSGITDPLITPTTKSLANDIEFPLGMSKLEAINQLLSAINYNNVYTNENGRFVCEPYQDPLFRPAQASYITNDRSIIFAGVKEELDAFNIPNKVVRYLDSADRATLISEQTNTDADSPLSTVSRGRTIVDIKSVNDIADQTTLDDYTKRAMDGFKVYERVTIETATMPNHGNLDCLYVVDKELDISGKFIEESWNVQLTNGGRMKHVLRKVVAI